MCLWTPSWRWSSEDCSGYRPIALQNQDIKLLSKILALRLERVLPFLTREDQTGFIKGRSSSFNVRRLLHIINICQTQEIDSMIISLDAEKAFDCVEWSYPFNVLHRLNLGDNFIRWVKLLYENPMAAVITNGCRSDNFPLHRSTRYKWHQAIWLKLCWIITFPELYLRPLSLQSAGKTKLNVHSFCLFFGQAVSVFPKTYLMKSPDESSVNQYTGWHSLLFSWEIPYSHH